MGHREWKAHLFFRLGIVLWLSLTAVLAYESYCLNYKPQNSILKRVQPQVPALADVSLSPDPGRPISMFLGYAGLGIMIIMNLYSLRKRFHMLGRVLPEIPRMLDFHIFCGLMGPTLILFHSNFKVRGLVAISFWSMLVSAGSGVIGRYFYVQIAKNQKDVNQELEALRTSIVSYLQRKLPNFDSNPLFDKYVAFAGLSSNPSSSGLIGALFNSVVGDLKLAFARPIGNIPERAHLALVKYASLRRKEGFVGQFQKLMGYWHTFHLPFAYFMYIAAFFHVIAALVLGVAK